LPKSSKPSLTINSIERPRIRADCKDVPRPCPFVSCRHNTFLNVNEKGKLKIIQDVEDVTAMNKDNCSLDIVDKYGALTLEEIGKFMNVTRERVRQIADVACRKMRP